MRSRTDKSVVANPGRASWAGLFSRLLTTTERCQWQRNQANWDQFMAEAKDFADLECRENALDRQLGQNPDRPR